MKVMLAWYAVSDLEKAKAFYGGVLGLKKTFEMPGWAEYAEAEGAAAIGLNTMAPAEGPGGATVVLRVESLDATRKRLAAKGVAFEGDVMEIPGVVRIGTFRDPFGNRLQVAQSLIG